MNKYLTILFFLFCISKTNAADVTAVVTNTSPGNSIGAIALSISVGVAPYTFQWSGPNGFNSTSKDITGLKAGNYTVTVTDKYCGIATLTLFVDSSATNIQENEFSNIQVYPNPADQYFAISNIVGVKYNLEMMSMTGQKLLSKENLTNEEYIKVADFPSGTYSITLTSLQNTRQIRLVLIH